MKRSFILNISFFLAIFLLVFADVSYADSCSSIDHRPRLPPVRDQMGTEWCYAFTAADLLSFEAGQAISAIGVGIQTQRDFRVAIWKLPNASVFTKSKITLQSHRVDLFDGVYDLSRGGDVEVALLANMHLTPALCIEEDLPQREYSMVIGDKPRGMRTREGLDAIRDLVKSKHPSERRVLPPDAEQCDSYDAVVNFLFPSANLSDFRNLALTINQSTDPLGEIYDLACQRRVHISKDLKTVKVQKEDDGDSFMRALDQQLERSPAAISYHMNSLKNPDFAASGSNHASSIVGRRPNPETGQCEYLLRNSWGKSCDSRNYHSSFSCEAGHVWIPAATLQKMTFNFTGLQ